ncbi:hypothetical protein, partial [Pseudomonas aeruginosa]|uniref:hypothetical protein n=1 Tax=Pseudomonas aeruginosa TaxID=287 RepID=UPI001C8C9AF8
MDAYTLAERVSLTEVSGVTADIERAVAGDGAARALQVARDQGGAAIAGMLDGAVAVVEDGR